MAVPCSPPGQPADAAATSKAAPFHTGTDPGDLVYHDSSDCSSGQVRRVIVDPVAEAVTHLVIGPERRRDPGRLVPLDLIDATAGHIRLRCAQAEFGKVDPAEETQFIPGTGSYTCYGPGQVVSC